MPQNLHKRCPHCKHQLIGPESIRGCWHRSHMRCPRCHRCVAADGTFRSCGSGYEHSKRKDEDTLAVDNAKFISALDFLGVPDVDSPHFDAYVTHAAYKLGMLVRKSESMKQLEQERDQLRKWYNERVSALCRIAHVVKAPDAADGSLDWENLHKHVAEALEKAKKGRK